MPRRETASSNQKQSSPPSTRRRGKSLQKSLSNFRPKSWRRSTESDDVPALQRSATTATPTKTSDKQRPSFGRALSGLLFPKPSPSTASPPAKAGPRRGVSLRKLMSAAAASSTKATTTAANHLQDDEDLTQTVVSDDSQDASTSSASTKDERRRRRRRRRQSQEQARGGLTRSKSHNGDLSIRGGLTRSRSYNSSLAAAIAADKAFDEDKSFVEMEDLSRDLERMARALNKVNDPQKLLLKHMNASSRRCAA